MNKILREEEVKSEGGGHILLKTLGSKQTLVNQGKKNSNPDMCLTSRSWVSRLVFLLLATNVHFQLRSKTAICKAYNLCFQSKLQIEDFNQLKWDQTLKPSSSKLGI